MKLTFEDYLIMVGIRSADYTYTDEQIFGNTEYFKKCYTDNLSAYKALLFLHDYLQDADASTEPALHKHIVSQRSELKPQNSKATWQCDECDKWYEPADKCPHCGFCG